jgi:CheY-like chemotaxis protein
MNTSSTDSENHDAAADDGPYPHLKTFLLSKGIARHKQTGELAGLLGLAKTSIFRKFKGDSSFTLPELKTIADHFGTDVETLRGVASNEAEKSGSTLEAARVNIQGLPALAEIEVGLALQTDDVCDLVAIKRSSLWDVFLWGAPELRGHAQHSIKSLKLSALPHPRIAVLEDDPGVASLTRNYLESEGMVTHVYEESNTLIKAIGHRPYQGYVVDWILGGGTAQAAIEAIRALQTHAPIAITTGALNTGKETEGELIPFAERLGAGIFEKPFRHAVLASYLRRGMATDSEA